jgi:transcriptional regulator with XRE-family HTH domain
MRRVALPTDHPGRRLREVREMCGLTQEELAWRSGLDRATISRYERGMSALEHAKFETLAAIGDALGVTVERLPHILNIRATRSNGAA